MASEDWLSAPSPPNTGTALFPESAPAPAPAPAPSDSAGPTAATAAPAIVPAGGNPTPPIGGAQSTAIAPVAAGNEPRSYGHSTPEGVDPRIHKLVREQVRAQDDLSETMEELGPKLDVVEEKLLGGKRKDRKRGGQQGISPLEMLACLQTVVDEHRMMEAESLGKDEELSKLRQELNDAIERQSALVQEKHEFLKQQNQLLIGQHEDQKTLVELQHVRETHARDVAELNSKLAAALEKAEGMSTIDSEMSRLRVEHGAAVASLNDQLMRKEADIAEVMALLAESKRNSTAANASLDSMRKELGELESQARAATAESAAGDDTEGDGGGAARAEEREKFEEQLVAARASATQVAEAVADKEAETAAVTQENATLGTKLEELAEERNELRAATARQAAESEAQALDKVKQILQKVYATLGEQFVDGEEFDGAVVRGAIKQSILQAMKS